MNLIEKDPFLKRLDFTNWIILGSMTFLSFLLMPHTFTLGLIVGGIISIFNFYWLKHDLRKVFRSLNMRAKSRLMFKYYIRFGVTAVILYLIVKAQMLNFIGLLIGLSIVIINLVITAIILTAKKNRPEEVN
ncbi:MAG TPA: ATP synthase subunit I [Syntrophales bacterium]|nr:ATP synthase subunit I [Syntrophales bacterium]HOL58252.1 ATP synthase subunit I [Syntrophales bacterium]HPO34421.1 ATP synthase subunit I [Syntrophales bacterium]